MKSKIKSSQHDFVYFDALRSATEEELHCLSAGDTAVVLQAEFLGRSVEKVIAVGSESECQEFIDNCPNEAIQVINIGNAESPLNIELALRNCHNAERTIRRRRQGLHETEDRRLLPDDVRWESRPMPYKQNQAEMLFLFGGRESISVNRFIECSNPVLCLQEMAEMLRKYPSHILIFTERVQQMLVCRPNGSKYTTLEMLKQEDHDLLSGLIVETYPAAKAVFFRAGVLNTMGKNVLVVH